MYGTRVMKKTMSDHYVINTVINSRIKATHKLITCRTYKNFVETSFISELSDVREIYFLEALMFGVVQFFMKCTSQARLPVTVRHAIKRILVGLKTNRPYLNLGLDFSCCFLS